MYGTKKTAYHSKNVTSALQRDNKKYPRHRLSYYVNREGNNNNFMADFNQFKNSVRVGDWLLVDSHIMAIEPGSEYDFLLCRVIAIHPAGVLFHRECKKSRSYNTFVNWFNLYKQERG